MESVLGKIKVLIVEDDFLISDEISRIIKKLGHQLVGVASNGTKALEMIKVLSPDVIIMDIKMPKMNGLEVSRKITEENGSAAIIILTAHESHDLVEEASKSGVAAYLTKPPKAEEIERAIYIALARNRDLQESKRLVRELEEHKLQLAELNATKDRFFSILAHDMRNPVSALYTFSDYLNTNINEISPDDLHQYLSVIHSTSKGISDLLEELFLWASLRSNRYHFKPETISLNDIVGTVISLLTTCAAQKNITLSSNVPSDMTFYADRNMIHTVVRNLVSNAIKFTPNNGQVTISAIESNEEVKVNVQDTGIGISKKDISRLFRIDEHFTTTGTDGETGSGLGLVLCKELIEKNKGKIWVESEPECGSNFIFIVPKNLSHE